MVQCCPPPACSTLAGEVEDPKRTFPKALLGAVILVVVAYVFPLLAGTGAFPYSHTEWNDGYFAVVASAVGGRWLGVWITCAAALASLGAFETEMSRQVNSTICQGKSTAK